MRWVRLLVPGIYLACALAFVADLTHDNSLAYGVAYLPLICTAVFHRRPQTVWWLAACATVLIGVGYFIPAINSDVVESVGNRLLSILAVIVTAALVRYARGIQERLAEQTALAEAAEQLKTEVFTNLSHEIRTPLHAIIGFAELMMANCRSDQRLPLGQMQNGGKRLLGTIDNLIDLTNLDRRVLSAVKVDVAVLTQQAAEAARSRAGARNASIVSEIAEESGTCAIADPWAVRRILDNLLSNSLKVAGPEGLVTLRVETFRNWIVATVQDTGAGMPAEMVLQLNHSSAGEAAAFLGAGLTLSRRLAAAMGGELMFDSEPGRGTTVKLRMPSYASPQTSR